MGRLRDHRIGRVAFIQHLVHDLDDRHQALGMTCLGLVVPDVPAEVLCRAIGFRLVHRVLGTIDVHEEDVGPHGRKARVDEAIVLVVAGVGPQDHAIVANRPAHLRRGEGNVPQVQARLVMHNVPTAGIGVRFEDLADMADRKDMVIRGGRDAAQQIFGTARFGRPGQPASTERRTAP